MHLYINIFNVSLVDNSGEGYVVQTLFLYILLLAVLTCQSVRACVRACACVRTCMHAFTFQHTI